MQKHLQTLSARLVALTIVLTPWLALAGGSDAGGGVRSVSVSATGPLLAATFTATTLLWLKHRRR